MRGISTDDVDSIIDYNVTNNRSSIDLNENEQKTTTNRMRRKKLIVSFCQYIEATLNRMSDDQIDRIIEETTIMLIKRKRAFHDSSDENESTTV